MINAEVQKSGTESALSVIRKFSRRVQGTGLVRAVRGGRYYTRTASKIVKKKRALKLIKEGKVIEAPTRHGQGGRPSYRSPQTEQTSAPKPAETTPIAR